jgi:mono/diheme cytochrome c family protein/DNA-binding beta-propeller fold protein YncE
MANAKLAVASDPDRDHVYVVDLAAWKLAFDVALQPGDEPGRVAEGPADRVFVALRRGGAVVTLDTATGAITERRPVCSAPRGLAWDAASSRLHVACADGQLITLAATGATAVRTLTLPPDLRDVVVTETGLLVSRFRSAEVLTVNAAGAVTNRLTPKSFDDRFAASVAWRLRAVPGGGALLVHQSSLDVAIQIDGSPAVQDTQHFGTYGSSGLCGAIVQAAVTFIATDGTSTTYLPSNNVLPVDGVIDPTTGTAAIAHAAMTAPNPAFVNYVKLDPMAAVRCGSESDLRPALPQAVTATYSYHPPGQTVAIDTAAGRVVVQTREPATLWRDDGSVLTLSTERHADVGHAIFHSSSRGLACASCHPEGGEDGRVWKFDPIGSRRTPSLRGGISGTEPFHWDGELPTLSALVDEVWVRRMAGPRLAPDQVAELRRWLDTIPALPRAAGDAAVVSRGRALFEDAALGCATCHVGPTLTNNTTVDVGTGLSLQVPSLRGLAWRPPYLHDGCAVTVTDRFGACGGGDKHGHTSQLAPSQLADLTAYLLSL